MWDRIAADPAGDYTKELRGATFGAVVGAVSTGYFAYIGQVYIAAVFAGFCVAFVQAGRFAAALKASQK